MSDPGLRDEILSHTGSDRATAAILRSIDRFGGDKSIGHYEIEPKARRGSPGVDRTVAWTVRAVRD